MGLVVGVGLALGAKKQKLSPNTHDATGRKEPGEAHLVLVLVLVRVLVLAPGPAELILLSFVLLHLIVVSDSCREGEEEERARLPGQTKKEQIPPAELPVTLTVLHWIVQLTQSEM